MERLELAVDVIFAAEIPQIIEPSLLRDLLVHFLSLGPVELFELLPSCLQVCACVSITAYRASTHPIREDGYSDRRDTPTKFHMSEIPHAKQRPSDQQRSTARLAPARAQA